jgi:hypothetical protein
MAERAGREVDASEGVLRVDPETAAVGAETVELGSIEPALQVQRRVERQRRVALREESGYGVRPDTARAGPVSGRTSL